MKGISILMYHQVGDFKPMQAHRANYCHYKRFGTQMAYLQRPQIIVHNPPSDHTLRGAASCP